MNKDDLREYKWIQENIQELEDRLLEIDTKLQRITSNLNSDIVQTTPDPDKWSDLISQRIELSELINAEITNGYREMRRIEETIENLDNREKRLMRLRYIKDLKWEEICVVMNYEWRQIHRIHNDALGRIGG